MNVFSKKVYDYCIFPITRTSSEYRVLSPLFPGNWEHTAGESTFCQFCFPNSLQCLLLLGAVHISLLLVMLLVELQNTCKKGWTEKRSNICYIFEKMRVQGFQIWHSHSTRPQIIQLFLTMQKILFTTSFQAKFLKIRFTKVADTNSSFCVPAKKILLSQCQQVPGTCLAK